METTVRQEERRQLIDRVLSLDAATYLYSGVGANVGLIETEIEREIRQGALDWMAYDIQSVLRVAVAKAESGALCANPRSVEAFQTVFADPQFIRKSGVGANESMIINELVSRGPLECTPVNISQVILDLWNQLVDNRDFQQTKSATDRRARQIAEMTGNGEHGFSIQRGPRKFAFDKFGHPHDPLAGQAQGLSLGLSGPWSRGANSRGFDQLSDDEVAQMYSEWSATESYKNMSVEQLREVVKKNGATDLFGKNVRVPSVVAPGPEDRLYHPTTGEPFTQKSLIRYINAAPYNGRNLITRNDRIVPRLRQLFEATVRGELG